MYQLYDLNDSYDGAVLITLGLGAVKTLKEIKLWVINRTQG